MMATAIGRTAKARAAALGAGLGCGALLLSLMGAQPGWAEPAPAGPALTVDRTTDCSTATSSTSASRRAAETVRAGSRNAVPPRA